VSFDREGVEEVGGVLEGDGGCSSGGVDEVENEGFGTASDNVHSNQRILQCRPCQHRNGKKRGNNYNHTRYANNTGTLLYPTTTHIYIDYFRYGTT